MKPIEIHEIDVKRFNALVTASRNPYLEDYSVELEWYANDDETILGVVLLDTTDDDFAAILMARDEGGRYRCFDLETCLESAEEAKGWLIRAMKWHTGQELSVYPQGDESPSLDLFTPVVPAEEQHPLFGQLTGRAGFYPARRIIGEMMPHFVDIDGNFVKEFQGKGLDARLWELYLNSYFIEEKLFIDREHHAPDFVVQKYGKSVAVEAVIVGRKDGKLPLLVNHVLASKTAEELIEINRHEMPIRFGSPLYSKLKKKYWELPHVNGKPLVFAIADFHDNQSMLWSSPALMDYLYGVHHDAHYEGENLVITPKKLRTHRVGEKEIPSGFFFQPEAEHVSAVLFSASGTISKFNRLGRQAGFCARGVRMIRVGLCHDLNPNASVPQQFKYEVDESCDESWGEGLSMFHNPNALIPVPQELFPSIAHHRFADGQMVSELPDFYPYVSQTIIIAPTAKSESTLIEQITAP